VNGPTDWTSPADFIDDPDAPDNPILVPSPVARERAGGVSLARQADLDRRRT
jgi:hypothetical protein